MSNLPPPPPPPPPGRGHGQQRRTDADRKSPERGQGEPTPPSSSGRGPGSWPKWTIWVLVGVLAAAFLVPSLWPSDSGETLEYSEWREQVIEGNIETAEINNGSAKITGEFTNGDELQHHR